MLTCILAIPIIFLGLILPILLIIDYWKTNENNASRIWGAIILIIFFPFAAYIYGVFFSSKSSYKIWATLGCIIFLGSFAMQGFGMNLANRFTLKALDHLEAQDFSYISFYADAEIKSNLKTLREELKGGYFQRKRRARAAGLIIILARSLSDNQLTSQEYTDWSNLFSQRSQMKLEVLEEYIKKNGKSEK
jgi:hypothetical protein